MELTEQQVKALKRKRGELDYSNKQLSIATGVSVWTLNKIIKHQHRTVNQSTFKKLNDWLINEYTTV